LTRTETVLSQSSVEKAIYCSGNNVGGYCDTHYYIDITFPKAFSVVPNVIVSPNLISDQGGAIGNATDQSYSKATNITKAGFRMWCSGSPMPGDPYNGWSTIGSCNWMAVPPE